MTPSRSPKRTASARLEGLPVADGRPLRPIPRYRSSGCIATTSADGALGADLGAAPRLLGDLRARSHQRSDGHVGIGCRDLSGRVASTVVIPIERVIDHGEDEEGGLLRVQARVDVTLLLCGHDQLLDDPLVAGTASRIALDCSWNASTIRKSRSSFGGDVVVRASLQHADDVRWRLAREFTRTPPSTHLMTAAGCLSTKRTVGGFRGWPRGRTIIAPDAWRTGACAASAARSACSRGGSSGSAGRAGGAGRDSPPT